MTFPPEQRRRLSVAIPTTLAVPVVLALVAVALAVELRPIPIVLGALGWVIALVLRAPVGFVAARVVGDPIRSQPMVTAASGPLEELVRVGVVVLLGRDVGTAVSIGLGWAAIEVLYGIVNAITMVALLSRNDPEAQQLRALLPFPDAVLTAAPLWGAFERVWASALHIAFTLLVAAEPALVAVTIPLHSATNLALLVAPRRVSFATVQVVGAVWAALILALAVLITLR